MIRTTKEITEMSTTSPSKDDILETFDWAEQVVQSLITSARECVEHDGDSEYDRVPADAGGDLAEARWELEALERLIARRWQPEVTEVDDADLPF